MELGDRFNEIKYAMNTRMFLMIAGAVLIFNAVTSTIPYGMRWFTVAQMVSDYTAKYPDGAPSASAVLSDAEVTAEEAVLSGTAVVEEAVLSDTSAVLEEAAVSDAVTALEEAAASDIETVSGEAVTPGAGSETASDGTVTEADIALLKQDMDKLDITVSDLRQIGMLNILMGIIRIVAGFLCVIFSNRVDKSRWTFTAAVALVCCESAFAVFMYFKRFLSIGSLFYTVFLAGILLFGAIRMRKIAKAYPDRKLAVETGRRRAAGAPPETPKKSFRERAQMGTRTDEEEENQEN